MLFTKKLNYIIGDGITQKDLSNWHTKIDSVYADFKKMREKCYILQSAGKFLNLRVKFKEHYEHVKKILKLDGANLDLVSLFEFFLKAIQK